MKKCFSVVIILLLIKISFSQEDITYKTPPKDILELVMAKPTPTVNINSRSDWMILLERSDFPTVEEMEQPEVRIAGLRLNPRNFGPSRAPSYVNLKLQNILTREEHEIGNLPENLHASAVQWRQESQEAVHITGR